MVYEILDVDGEVVKTIAAKQWFVDKYYPNRYREVEELDDPDAEQDEE